MAVWLTKPKLLNILEMYLVGRISFLERTDRPGLRWISTLAIHCKCVILWATDAIVNTVLFSRGRFYCNWTQNRARVTNKWLYILFIASIVCPAQLNQIWIINFWTYGQTILQHADTLIAKRPVRASENSIAIFVNLSQRLTSFQAIWILF